jgi:hypothetical protein
MRLQLALFFTLGLFATGSQASDPPIKLDAELVTGQQTDAGSIAVAALAQPLTMKLKNGTVEFSLSDQTDKTIRIHMQIFEGEKTRPIYNSTFLTNLNMDAEIREMRQDGSLFYKIKVTPRTPDKK